MEALTEQESAMVENVKRAVASRMAVALVVGGVCICVVACSWSIAGQWEMFGHQASGALASISTDDGLSETLDHLSFRWSAEGLRRTFIYWLMAACCVVVLLLGGSLASRANASTCALIRKLARALPNDKDGLSCLTASGLTLAQQRVVLSAYAPLSSSQKKRLRIVFVLAATLLLLAAWGAWHAYATSIRTLEEMAAAPEQLRDTEVVSAAIWRFLSWRFIVENGHWLAMACVVLTNMYVFLRSRLVSSTIQKLAEVYEPAMERSWYASEELSAPGRGSASDSVLK